MVNLFSERLKCLMHENALSQSQLAKAIEVNKNTVCAWLNDKKRPRLKTLCKIADYFKVKVDYLIGRCDR